MENASYILPIFFDSNMVKINAKWYNNYVQFDSIKEKAVILWKHPRFGS